MAEKSSYLFFGVLAIIALAGAYALWQGSTAGQASAGGLTQVCGYSVAMGGYACTWVGPGSPPGAVSSMGFTGKTTSRTFGAGAPQVSSVPAGGGSSPAIALGDGGTALQRSTLAKSFGQGGFGRTDVAGYSPSATAARTGRAVTLPIGAGVEVDLVGWLSVLLLLIIDIQLWYIYKSLKR